MNQSPQSKKHLLTVLVEDYFHVGAFENLIQQRNWSNFEARYEKNTLKTLDLLDEFKTKATFFVLGWIAEKNPNLIREIVSSRTRNRQPRILSSFLETSHARRISRRSAKNKSRFRRRERAKNHRLSFGGKTELRKRRLDFRHSGGRKFCL